MTGEATLPQPPEPKAGPTGVPKPIQIQSERHQTRKERRRKAKLEAEEKKRKEDEENNGSGEEEEEQLRGLYPLLSSPPDSPPHIPTALGLSSHQEPAIISSLPRNRALVSGMIRATDPEGMEPPPAERDNDQMSGGKKT